MNDIIDTSKLEIIPITYTNLSTYATCPYQYYSKYIAKTVPYESNPAMEEGNRAHAAIEDYIKFGTAIPKEVSYMQPYAEMMDRYKNETYINANGLQSPTYDICVEQTICLNNKWEPCSEKRSPTMGSKFIYCRADVRMTYNPTGQQIVIDWKTGKVRDDVLQAQVNGLCVARAYNTPYVRCVWVFVKHQQNLVTDLDFTTSEPLVEPMRLINELANSYSTCVWKKEKNGLCKAWCGVLDCPYNGRNNNG